MQRKATHLKFETAIFAHTPHRFKQYHFIEKLYAQHFTFLSLFNHKLSFYCAYHHEYDTVQVTKTQPTFILKKLNYECSKNTLG